MMNCMKFNKIALIMGLVLVLSSTMVACGNSKSTNSGNSNSSTTASDKKEEVKAFNAGDTALIEDADSKRKMQYKVETVYKGKTLSEVKNIQMQTVDGTKSGPAFDKVDTKTAKGEYIAVQLTVENLGTEAKNFLSDASKYHSGYVEDNNGNKYDSTLVKELEQISISSDNSKDEIKFTYKDSTKFNELVSNTFEPKFKYNRVLVFDVPNKDGDYSLVFNAGKKAVKIKLPK